MGETVGTLERVQYQLVDATPEAAMARQAVRGEAEALLASRQANQDAGVSEGLLPPVDALSTAHEVLKAARMYGEGSPEHRERSAGLVLDCKRLVMEWLRKKKPEYFSPLRHFFDESTEEFFSHGLSVRQMTENALMPIPDKPEEQSRRVNERVEDATPQILRKLGGVAAGTVIRTVSGCTDWAIADYERDMRGGNPYAGYGGYVPEIQKVMIRDVWLDSDTKDRFQEQVGLPGQYVTHFIIQKALGLRGADVMGMDKTELHGSQILARDSLWDFVNLLDQVASEQWCTNIFMGEEVPADHPKDYVAFKDEALARHAKLDNFARTVANFVTDLAEDDVDRSEAPGMVEAFVKKMILDVAKQDISLVEEIFDKKTAAYVATSLNYEKNGQYELAAQAMQKANEVAPGGGFCGAQCGIESVDTKSKEGKELMANLKAKVGDTLGIDKVRKCKCGAKGVAYAYNKDKVNKYCTVCKKFESKKSSVAA